MFFFRIAASFGGFVMIACLHSFSMKIESYICMYIINDNTDYIIFEFKMILKINNSLN